MADLENVVRHLYDCLAASKPENMCVFVRKDIVGEALNLLKEREPIPCGAKIQTGDVVLDFYECGYCKNAIRRPWRYCPFCGKAVKWNA